MTLEEYKQEYKFLRLKISYLVDKEDNIRNLLCQCWSRIDEIEKILGFVPDE